MLPGYVRMEGLEPPCLAALEPKSSASTYFATSATNTLHSYRTQRYKKHLKSWGLRPSQHAHKGIHTIMNNRVGSIDEVASQKYQHLYEVSQAMMQRGDDVKLQKAFQLALAVGQKKQHWEGSSSILHALDTATIIADEIGLGINLMICALLHNLTDDIAPTDIKKIFGTQVAQTTHKLAVLTSLPLWEDVHDKQSAEVLITALVQDPRVALIMLADNVHKMRTLTQLSREDQTVIASHTHGIYVPIAHRFGLNEIKAELEDLHLKLTNSVAYQMLTAQLQHTQNANERFIKRFMQPIQDGLQSENLDFKIKTRIKSVSSIRHKMQTIGLPLEDVYDVFAIRIILDVPLIKEKQVCWNVYRMVTNLYKPHPTRFRNWLSYPRKNGYQSLHITVKSNEEAWVEVQVRTRRMDYIAEEGPAAHWRYKETDEVTHLSGVDTWLTHIRSTLASARQSHDDKTLADTSKIQPETKTIQVFSPDAQLINLPVGTTLLDYAFARNTTWGLRCIGGKINNRSVALHTPLSHGDQVHIEIATTTQAHAEWGEFLVTQKAKDALIRFLQQARVQKLTQGKRLMHKHLKQLNLAADTSVITRLLVYFDEPNIEELYHSIGDGSITLRHLRGL
jgi:guanosine-3',5'-bis(diphosphate) 3'-pyrophosphohydrolase